MKKHATLIAIVGYLLICFILMVCSGCNKQIFDFKYTFDKAICYYGGERFELNIDKWNDYDGEQIQIISGNKTYLISANNCYLIDE